MSRNALSGAAGSTIINIIENEKARESANDCGLASRLDSD